MLQALRIDHHRVGAWLAAAPDGGRVHSVFTKACNLAWGDGLLSLTLPGHGMVPGGVEVAAADWDFRPGEPLRFAGGAIIGAGQRLLLDGAQIWTQPAPLGACAPGLGERLAAMTAVARRQGRGALVRLLADGAADEGGLATGPDWVAFARPAITALLEGGDPAEVAPALVGLGEGLTPSCDDFLLGVLGVLYYQGASTYGPLAAAVRQQAAGTTPVSANFLRLAASGGFGERIVAAALALLGAGDPVAAAAALIESGHSSGTDTLVGIIMAGRRLNV